MKDTFCIKIRCPRCGLDDILAATPGTDTPLLFDNVDAALLRASQLATKRGRIRVALDKGLDVGDEGNMTFECAKCHAIFYMYEVNPTPYRYPS